MKYRWQDMEVEAIQWDGENFADIAELTEGSAQLTRDSEGVILYDNTVLQGSWIIKFRGQEVTNGPEVIRYLALANEEFVKHFVKVGESNGCK